MRTAASLVRAMALGLVWPLAIVGCSAPQRQPAPDAVDPLDRMLYAERAAASGDAQAIPELIVMLASSDPAVRMIAQRSLERLTGQTLGYHHASSEPERQAAIERWVAWHRAQAAHTSAPR